MRASLFLLRLRHQPDSIAAFGGKSRNRLCQASDRVADSCRRHLGRFTEGFDTVDLKEAEALLKLKR
jgi:hypothetical protein